MPVYVCVLSVVTYRPLLVDETIGHVLTVLQAQSVPYTAVYTGQRPSHVKEHHTDHKLDKASIQIQPHAEDHKNLLIDISILAHP